MSPVKIQVVDKQFLNITWKDETNTVIKLVNLRRYCPCAVCNAERADRGEKYFPIYMPEQVAVSKINVVGNYAVSIEWKDGHNTGIYEFDFLRELSESIRR